MSLDEFLQSGILEAYALGQATPDEARLAEEMRAKFPDAEAEYQAIAESLETGAAQFAMKAPSGLWDKIQKEVEEQPEGQAEARPYGSMKASVNSAFSSSDEEEEGGRVVSIAGGGRRRQVFGLSLGWTTGLAAALVLSIGANIVQLRQNGSLRDDLAASERSLEVIAHTTSQSKEDMNRLKQESSRMEGLLAQALTPRNGVQEMGSMPPAGRAKVVMAYDAQNKIVALRATHMPDVPAGKVVQVWAIVGGKPVSLGEAEGAADGQLIVAEMPTTDGAPEAFALSLETGGIHAQPEGPILAMGKVN